jgi:transposase, IS5 family
MNRIFWCMSKGKDHKKYEFGFKVSIITTKTTGVIIGALNIEKNVHDSKTLEPAWPSNNV